MSDMSDADKSRLGPDGKPILRDEDIWTKIPYQVTLGKQFTTLADALVDRMVTRGLHKHRSSFNQGIDKDVNYSRFSDDPFDTDFLDNAPVVNDYVTTSYFKDTVCGGNDAINCLWQFGRDDDIVHPMLRSRDNSSDIGMGRVYAATTETDQQILWMTFGTAIYADIGIFLKNAFDKDLSILNEFGVLGNDSGDSELNVNGSIFSSSELGTALGLVISIPLMPLVWFKEFANRLTIYPCTRFCDLRATMHLYYTTVDSIIAQWLVATGLYGNTVVRSPLNKKYGENYEDSYVSRVENDYNPAGSTTSAATDTMPNSADLTGAGTYTMEQDLLNAEAGGDDVIKYHTYNEQVEALRGKPISMEEYNKTMSGWTAEKDSLPLTIRLTGPSIFDIMTNRLKTLALRQAREGNSVKNAYKELIGSSAGSGYAFASLAKKVSELYRLSPDQYDTGGANPMETEHLTNGWKTSSDWLGDFKAAALGGMQFVGFRVEKGTGADESFSNSTQPSGLAEQINSTIQQAASKLYDSGGKAQSTDTMVATLITSAVDVLQSTVGRLFDSFEAVNTGAAIDIPERYAGSDFNKSHSFKIKLNCPNGDVVSIYQSIIVPLALLLAAAVPRAAGPNSYQSPFLVRAYCKGMFAIPLGIVENLSINRGSDEFGWNYQNLPTVVEVNLTIKDLAPAMYLSIKDESLFDMLGSNSNFNEYMLTLAGVGMWERISFLSKMQRKMQLFFHTIRNRYTNANFWSSFLSETSVVHVVASFWPDTTVSYD